MRVLRVTSGALLAVLVLLLLWAGRLLEPPEAVSRLSAIISAVYPGPTGAAVAERITCPPLRRLRLYAVCTEGCEGVWRIVGVRGLQATNLQNLNRLPPEAPEDVRRGFNAWIAREGLRLDAQGARQMIGCYMRLDALPPELILREADAVAVERARASGEEAMAALAESLDEPGALDRVAIEEGRDAFTARFLYWSTAEAGRPVLETVWRLARDGRLLSVEIRPRPAITDGTASGSTPGTPPS